MKEFDRNTMKKTMILSLLLLAGCSGTPTDDTQNIKKLPVTQFESVKKEKQFILLDVRTPGEFQSGHIKGAKNIDYHGDFEKQIATLDKSKTYAIYCQAGVRSNGAAQKMASAGFKHLYDIPGGFGDWQAHDLPIEK